MPDLSHLDWPFFDEAHRRFAPALARWSEAAFAADIDRSDIDQRCRVLVRELGDAGWLKAVVPAAYGGTFDRLDVRTLCLAREILAWHDGLVDFAFAMQGLGTASISLFGSDALKSKYLPPVCAGRHIAAFALSEPEAGSDISALATTAVKAGRDHVRVDGVKTWISNGGIADYYVVFARTGEGPGSRGLSAFVVDADTPGLSVAGRIDVIAPHPLATLRFADCRVPIANRLGAPGEDQAANDVEKREAQHRKPRDRRQQEQGVDAPAHQHTVEELEHVERHAQQQKIDRQAECRGDGPGAPTCRQNVGDQRLNLGCGPPRHSHPAPAMPRSKDAAATTAVSRYYETRGAHQLFLAR